MLSDALQLSDILGRTPGDHICWTYSSDEDHRAVLASFFSEGIKARQKLIYMSSDATRGAVEDYLSDEGVDVAALIADGQLSLLDARHEYTPGGHFDPDLRLSGFRALAESAVEEGYPSVRLAAEASWLLDIPEIRSRWPLYEFRADVLVSRLPLVGLCCYDTRLVSHRAVATLASIHSLRLGTAADEEGSMFHMHATREGSLRVEGEIDLTCSPEVRGLLIAGWPEAGNTLDVSGLEFIDLPGMKAIADAVRVKASVCGSVELKGASPTFRKVWNLLSLSESRDIVLS